MGRALGPALLVLAADPRAAYAQFSPGALSQPHAALEGSSKCLTCHEPGRGVSPSRCLVCHTALGARIASGKGLHASPDFRACERCHIEHHGRDFALVNWGDAGQTAFEHERTGFALRGAHARAACATCHQSRRVRDPEALRRGGVSPDRTFLGLSTACASCHLDPHRGQFGERPCAECHGDEPWKTVDRFDHQRTRFPLTGRHQGAPCARCHAARADGSRKFAGTTFTSCTSCHPDAHAGRFGTTCTGCHTTVGWRQVAQGRVDHERTRFPLRGQHARVACDKCHNGARGLRPSFAECADCHPDRHAGQLADRAAGDRCESCHTVEGFAPARFTVEDHQGTRFPLTGSHLAVPCDACHRQVPADRLLAAGVARTGGGPTEQLRFASRACADCHRDPHAGDLARWGTCTACHVTSAWREVTFDHTRTRFPLAGAHASVECRKCHTVDGALAIAGRPTDCAACHREPHGGRFARQGRTECARCHLPAGWRSVRFDHDRETTFPLIGAHRAVACAACHGRGKGGALTMLPAPGRECVSCHTSRAVGERP